MSRVLGAPQISADRRSLAEPRVRVDAMTQRMIDDARQQGYEAGVAEGHQQGRAEAAQARDAAANAVAERASSMRDELSAFAHDRAAEVTDLAAAIAEFVVGHEPHDEGQALLARIRETLEAIDDEPLRVRCCPEDETVVAAGLAEIDGVEVVADPKLGRGEASVDGRWAGAQLTHEAAWARLREVLGGDDG